METRIPIPKANTTDELATKAAAWAWYQHGIGSEDKSLEEISTRRIHQLPKPSRFKLEAEVMIRKANIESLQENSDSEILSNNHSDISLFDAYEIEMISKRFDSLIKHARDTYQYKYHNINDPWKKTSLQGNVITIKKSTKKSNGFWLVTPARICGSSEDVVSPRRLLAGNPGKDKVIKHTGRTASRRSYSRGPIKVGSLNIEGFVTDNLVEKSM